MEMASTSSLEIKVMFGKDLKGFNFFQKLTIYVLVSIVSDDPGKELEQKQKHMTPADKEGDGCPEWNHGMRFDLRRISLQDCDHIFALFELKHRGVMFGDKPIGEVRVPIKDLISDFNGVFRFVDYQVRSPDGKPNGVLTFSYKVSGMNKIVGTTSSKPGTPQITGYPNVAQDSQHPESAIQYPQALYPTFTSAPGSLYPRLEMETATMQQQLLPAYSTQQGVQYAPPEESYHYPPQPSDAYYALYPQQPPPASPTAHDASSYYHYPPSPMAHPSGFNPWPGTGSPHLGFNHCYSMPWSTWDDHSDGNGHSFGHRHAPSNGYPSGIYRHSYSWSGR